MATIHDKMIENRLKWFGHVKRRPLKASVRRVNKMGLSSEKRGSERSTKTLEDIIKSDLVVNNIL